MLASSPCTDVPRGSACEQLFDGVRQRLFHSTRYAVLGGGGVYGIMYIGALMELCAYSRTLYVSWASKLRGVAGTSVGAVIGIMVAAGLDPWDMRAIVHKAGMKRLLDSVVIPPLQPADDTHEPSVNVVAREIVKAVTGSETTTFAQFYKQCKREFIVTVANTKLSTAEFWSHRTQPDLELWHALRASTSVPGILPPHIIDDVAYVDGGIMCNLPCHMYPPHKTLSLFVHALYVQPAVSKLTDMALFTLTVILSAAQLGPMRMSGALAARGVPCNIVKANTGILRQFAFDIDAGQFDALMLDGARSVRGLLFRDVLLCCCIIGRIWPYIPFPNTKS